VPSTTDAIVNGARRNVSRVTELPILVLNLHSHCNCRCLMCDIWKRETHQEFPAADLEPHRQSLRALGVKQIVLTGGEPLLHSHLDALCAFFRAELIRITLLSTGLLLQKRAAEVCADFDEIIISLDGPAEIHDRVRRVKSAFELLRNGISAVRAIRPSLRIAARCTVQKTNHTHLRATVAAAQSLGLDSLSFLAADLTSQAFNRDLVWPLDRQQQIGLTAAEVLALDGEIEALIRECSSLIRNGYISESPEKLRRIVRHFRAHLGQVPFASPLCNAPWVSAVIEVDGSVRPCFFHQPFANLHSATLEDAVNSEQAQLFRESLSVALDPICQRCVCSLHRPSSSAV